MYDSELVVLFYYGAGIAVCERKTFAALSDEAKFAHARINKLRQKGKKILDIELLSVEELSIYEEYIESMLKLGVKADQVEVATHILGRLQDMKNKKMEENPTSTL